MDDALKDTKVKVKHLLKSAEIRAKTALTLE